MSQHTPFTIVSTFLNNLPEETRKDLKSHVLTAYRAIDALRDMGSSDIDSEYDKYFSDGSVDIYSYLGRIISLRSFIDYYIWSMTDQYNIRKHDELMDLGDKHQELSISIPMLKESFKRRSYDVNSARQNWDSIKDGPLSNVAIAEYTMGICIDSARDRG
ncbi:MAG: hypothetical protein ACLPIC_16645 [Rhodoblastus sp.]|uniref:hypothetical protein n=1 Tax=Rhodoblastus sp. TaxID=1962975 RepID=UPI003F9E9AB0